jgi:DNA methylase.
MQNPIIMSIPAGNYIIQMLKNKKTNFGETITRVDGNIPVDLPVENGQSFLFISYDQSALTHGLHKYPAKFFPELPRWLINRYSKKNDIVLDPFSGSGTTNVEALIYKRNSIGIDVDPFSKFLSKVKTTQLNVEELKYSHEELLENLTRFTSESVNDKDIPNFPYRDNWFQKEIILELAYIRRSINELKVNQYLRNFYYICLSSIIRSVSNADNNCTRTVIRKKLNKNIYPSMALTKFAETILLNVPKMIEFSKLDLNGITAEFPEDNDARKIKYPNEYFDLAITSPPYANAVDYPRTHQLEMYWLGLANGSLTPLKRKHVGTESVKITDYQKLREIGISEADLVIERIYKKDPRRAYIVYKYLWDMETNLNEVYRVLKTNGRYIVVVGNNTIRGNTFENWKYIMKLSQKIGFEIESYFTSEIIRHFIKVPRTERINTDWIIVLRK